MQQNPGEGEEKELKEVMVDPRVYINAFPKSGTHLVEQMVSAICVPMPADKPWAGSFFDHSWTTKWAPTRNIYRRLGLIVDGTYAKGHMGYKEAVEMFLWGNRIATLFIYRDLRDVAVSLTHHIVTRSGSHSHPEWYEALGFDGALMAVIRGLKQYAGVIERWNQYAGWLDVSWVEKFSYEKLLENREGEARRMIEYITGFCITARGLNMERFIEGSYEEAVKYMVAQSSTGTSPTFRKGVAGEWRHEFKPAHVRAFKREDRKWARRAGVKERSWLIHLGYEKSTNWGL